MEKIHSKLLYNREVVYPICLKKNYNKRLKPNISLKKMKKAKQIPMLHFTQQSISLEKIMSQRIRFKEMKMNKFHCNLLKTHQKKMLKAFFKIQITRLLEIWN